jgi:hypothetical protein
MKAISITQPWATLIAQGAKRIETRSWKTSYRGPLAIHASKGLPGWVADVVRSNPQFAAALGNLFEPRGRVLGDLPRGCIIATCQLFSVEPIGANAVGWDWISARRRRYSYPITDAERAFGDYTPGRYAWLLADVQPLDAPVPAKGALGLWEWQVQA